MNLYKVTLFAKKLFFIDKEYTMSWVTMADTATGASEKVIDTLDLSVIDVIKWKVEYATDPYLVDIKE